MAFPNHCICNRISANASGRCAEPSTLEAAPHRCTSASGSCLSYILSMGKATGCEIGTLNITPAFNSPRCLSEGCRRPNKSLLPFKPPCLSQALQKANHPPLPTAVQPSCGTSYGTVLWHHPMALPWGTLLGHPRSSPAWARVLDHSPTLTDPAQGSLQISATKARNLHSHGS